MSAKQRMLPVAAAIAIQLCIGIAYIWSVFQTGIADSVFNGDNAAAGLTFSLLLALLSVGSVIGGKLAEHYSTRAVVISGGVVLSLGFGLASLVTSEAPWLLWLTYGVLGGLGMGFTYSTTIACAQKWFPEKKGLITGVIVSALGLGGVIFTPLVEWLIAAYGGPGLGERQTFLVLGVIFLVVCAGGGLFMKNPPPNYAGAAAPKGRPGAGGSPPAAAPARDYTPREMLGAPRFYLVAFAFALACMSGLMMIGFAKPIAVARGLAHTATLGVLLISMSNSLGRLLWGMVSDKLGRFNTIFILMGGTVLLSLLVNTATGYSIYVLIGLIGFFYGGVISNFPALTADLFGAKHLATNYGLVLMGFGAGAVLSSLIAGYYKNLAAADIDLMFPAFVLAAICSALAMGLMLILRRAVKPRHEVLPLGVLAKAEKPADA